MRHATACKVGNKIVLSPPAFLLSAVRYLSILAYNHLQAAAQKSKSKTLIFGLFLLLQVLVSAKGSLVSGVYNLNIIVSADRDIDNKTPVPAVSF